MIPPVLPGARTGSIEHTTLRASIQAFADVIIRFVAHAVVRAVSAVVPTFLALAGEEMSRRISARKD